MRDLDNENTIRERLLSVCSHIKVSTNKLSEDAGLNRNYITRIKDTVSSDLLRYIYQHYDNIDIEWVLTGNGNMLAMNGAAKKNISIALELLHDEYQRNKKLSAEVNRLRNKLSQLENL